MGVAIANLSKNGRPNADETCGIWARKRLLNARYTPNISDRDAGSNEGHIRALD